MSYAYENEKSKLFDDEGQRMFIKMRDTTFGLLREAGAVKMSSLMRGLTGDTWTMLACADRMIELGDLTEITPETVAGQDRVFVRKP